MARDFNARPLAGSLGRVLIAGPARVGKTQAMASQIKVSKGRKALRAAVELAGGPVDRAQGAPKGRL